MDTTSKAKGSWLSRNVVTPFKQAIRDLTPEGVALSVAFGVTCGLFPIPGVTTAACVVAFALLTRLGKGPLSLAAAQIVNMLITPLNLGTFIVFIRAGEALLRVEPVELSVTAFRDNPFGSIGTFWTSLMCGVVVWLLLVVPLTYTLYWALKPAMRILMRKGRPASMA